MHRNNNLYKNIIRVYLLFILITTGLSQANAQEVENTFQTRTEFKMSYKLTDKWKILAIPELRFDDSYSIDKYILELKTVYTPIKRLSLGASYRFIANQRTTKDSEYLQRYAFDASYKYKINRWTPKVRLRYTNYSEDNAQGEFMRYKASVDYNIKKSKFTPFAGAEIFHEISENHLYKVRYSLGSEYKINKKNAISLAYKLDYYQQKFENKHIMYVGYKLKF